MNQPLPTKPLPPVPAQAPRARRRWGWWSFLVLLVAITATAPTGWLPRLANALLREYLSVRDLSGIQIRIERLTPWHLRAALQFGTNAPVSRIDRLDVRYSPGSLWHARLDRVEVMGGLLQVAVTTNGFTLCGLPPDLARLRPGASPLADDEDVPATWQVGQGLLDNVTLRLLPPEAIDGSRGRSPSLSTTNSSTGADGRATAQAGDRLPFDLCLHASAVTDPQGETRFAISDYGRAGLLANGSVRLESGDGWLVAALPESQVQEWLRVVQWYVRDPRFAGADLCAGNGGATFLARMEQWRPAVAQGDLALRAASRLPDASLTYDLRIHGVAQWEEAETLRPTLSANVELGVRMAACPAFAWSDDSELPARANIALKLTPQRTEWEGQVAVRAMLSHEAVQACLPDASGLTTGALRLRMEGTFTSADLQNWAGEANAMLLAPSPRWSAHDVALSGNDLVLHATARVDNSKLVSVRGQVDAAGLLASAGGVSCAAEAGAAFAARAPFDRVDVAVTTRVQAVTLPAGKVVLDGDRPLEMQAVMSLLVKGTNVDVIPSRLSILPWQARVAGVEVGMPKGLDVPFCGGSIRNGVAIWDKGAEPLFLRWDDGSAVTAGIRVDGAYGVPTGDYVAIVAENMAFGVPGLTGGVAYASLGLAGETVDSGAYAPVLGMNLNLNGAWARDSAGWQVEGLWVHLPLALSNRTFALRDTPGLIWTNLEYEGLHAIPEGFALTLTGQTATAQMQVGVPEVGVHASLQAHADWSHAWQVAVTAAVPPATLVDNAELRRLSRKFSGYELSITGQVSATASALLTADRQPTLRIVATVTNLDVGCSAEQWQVSGIATHVALDGPRGWRTSQGQMLTFCSAKRGNLHFDAGTVQWQYRREALLVEQADVGWCKGLLHVYGLTYNPHDPDLDFVVYADQIHLGALMAQTRALHGTGEGRLYGRMPISIKYGKLHLTDSYLHTMSGETGVMKMENTDLLDAALAAGKVDAGVRERVQKALRNLKLSVFRLQLSGSGASAVMGVHIEGRPADDPAGQGVDMNVNLHGPLDDLFQMSENAAGKFQ
ncbi:MAG: intermembrane phospholipid transport protein YdbH family protein [Kiritimatiellia bacterium]